MRLCKVQLDELVLGSDVHFLSADLVVGDRNSGTDMDRQASGRLGLQVRCVIVSRC